MKALRIVTLGEYTYILEHGHGSGFRHEGIACAILSPYHRIAEVDIVRLELSEVARVWLHAEKYDGTTFA